MSPPKKMVILRGNSAEAGTYPDERGRKIAWPSGALHVWAASEYARRRGYKPVLLDVPGQPQSETSPQATEALKRFLEDPDQSVTAFYGFSGGGYNLRYILSSLAKNHPEALHRIDRVVVLGAPGQPPSEYEASNYNKPAEKRFNELVAQKKIAPAKWEPLKWDVVYRKNPPKSVLPRYVPKDLETHMFGPEALLSEADPDVLLHDGNREQREGSVRFSPMRVRGHHH